MDTIICTNKRHLSFLKQNQTMFALSTKYSSVMKSLGDVNSVCKFYKQNACGNTYVSRVTTRLITAS